MHTKELPYQLRLYTKADPTGWLAAQGRAWSTTGEALAYLEQVFDHHLHTGAALFQNGKIMQRVEPRTPK